MEVYLELQEEFNSIQIKDFIIWNPCLRFLKQTFSGMTLNFYIWYYINSTVIQSDLYGFHHFTIWPNIYKLYPTYQNS